MNPKRAKTPEEQREREIENQIDDWIEARHLTEVPILTEGSGEDY